MFIAAEPANISAASRVVTREDVVRLIGEDRLLALQAAARRHANIVINDVFRIARERKD